MIEHINQPNTNEEIFESLNPFMKTWFKEKFGGFSDAQKYAIIPIRNRKNILVSSPTGSGKTLCGFTSILNYLIDLDLKNELENKVYAVYISPLKALAGDIEVNLKRPLEEMETIAGHLKEGVVGATVEIVVVQLDSEINRKYDEKIGLNLMDF